MFLQVSTEVNESSSDSDEPLAKRRKRESVKKITESLPLDDQVLQPVPVTKVCVSNAQIIVIKNFYFKYVMCSFNYTKIPNFTFDKERKQPELK